MSTVTAPGLADEVLGELRDVVGDEHLLVDKPARMHRARVPAPFPVHRWARHIPDVVVLPACTEEVAAVIEVANRFGVPVVPRCGGTGLTDGAVPLHHGILLDVKRLQYIGDIDLENRTCVVGAGVNMLKLNEALARHDLFYPDDPASYPCSLVGGRIGTSGWSLIGSRYGHTRDLVLSFLHVLPTGEVIRIGEGGGPRISKSSSGYQMKQLFMGHQGTLGVATEATLKLYPKPEAEFSPFWAFEEYDTGYRAVRALAQADVATFAGAVLFDEEKVRYLRRDDEAYIPQPENVRALVCSALYGNEDEVRAGAGRLMRIARSFGARYMGDEISQGDWAARHDRYATPLHGRTKAGQVVPMSWHCEDAAINWSALPAVREQWHRIVADLRSRSDVFDDWGMFSYTSARTGVDYLTEIDVGIWEQELDEETWAMWVDAKREIARVAVAHGGSISACHGSCREGEVDVVPEELGGAYEVMRKIKRTLDPANVMNPGKYGLDGAFEEDLA
ncbi:MAG TPA: FAD-binding oxidoreductase [Solirubrobacteraceae bacterium]|nr:FAD-binding oxidoreductase [Solirubrobacteraceae bacterium]